MINISLLALSTIVSFLSTIPLSNAISDRDLVSRPPYCYIDIFECYKYGAPLCCIRSSTACPSVQPQCDITGRQQTQGSDNANGSGGIRCNLYQDVCAIGTKCYQNRCTDVIPAGGICSLAKICKDGYCRARNVCEEGYFCSNQRCKARRTGSCQEGNNCNGNTFALIPVGGSCVQSSACESGLCSGGRCVKGCQSGNGCDSGYTCLQGVCTQSAISAAPTWFTNNYQYCVMECQSINNPRCKGMAQLWHHVYNSVEECCSQSTFQENYERCLTKSLQYSGEILT